MTVVEKFLDVYSGLPCKYIYIYSILYSVLVYWFFLKLTDTPKDIHI